MVLGGVAEGILHRIIDKASCPSVCRTVDYWCGRVVTCKGISGWSQWMACSNVGAISSRWRSASVHPSALRIPPPQPLRQTSVHVRLSQLMALFMPCLGPSHRSTPSTPFVRPPSWIVSWGKERAAVCLLLGPQAPARRIPCWGLKAADRSRGPLTESSHSSQTTSFAASQGVKG
jgi:hypothetical protein